MNIRLAFTVSIMIIFASIYSSAVTLSGANIPFDSSLHMGLVNGPGTGVNVGVDMFFPLESVSVGGEIEQLVTNNQFEQNLNIQKFGIVLKQVISEQVYLTYHLGTASFYVTKTLEYTDSFKGERYTIDEDTHGSATYYAFAPNIKYGEFIITPKIILNNISSGGTIVEIDLNIGHKF